MGFPPPFSCTIPYLLHGVLTVEPTASLSHRSRSCFVQIFIECLEAKVLLFYSCNSVTFRVTVVAERLNEWLLKDTLPWNCSSEHDDSSSGKLSQLGSPPTTTTSSPCAWPFRSHRPVCRNRSQQAWVEPLPAPLAFRCPLTLKS